MDIDDYQKAKAKRINRLAFVVFAGLLGVTWAAMANCSGWNEGSMEVKACRLDGALARFIANQLYNLVLLSAFTLFIPFLLYASVLWGIARTVASTLVALFPR